MAKKELDLSFLKPIAEELELPSKGLPYNKENELSKGKIHIRPWMTSEEKILDKFDRGNFFNVIKKLVQNAVIEKINIDDMTDADVFFVLYWLRVITYGSTYKISTDCPECGSKIDVEIDIKDYPIKYMEKFKPDYEITLPISKIKLRMKFPKFGSLIEATESKHSDLYKMGIKMSPEIYRYAICTEEMTLPTETNDILTKADDLNLMLNKIWPMIPAGDLVEIKKYLNQFDHGYNENASVQCPECQKFFNQAPIMTDEFFRPSGR